MWTTDNHKKYMYLERPLYLFTFLLSVQLVVFAGLILGLHRPKRQVRQQDNCRSWNFLLNVFLIQLFILSSRIKNISCKHISIAARRAWKGKSPLCPVSWNMMFVITTRVKPLVPSRTLARLIDFRASSWLSATRMAGCWCLLTYLGINTVAVTNMATLDTNQKVPYFCITETSALLVCSPYKYATTGATFAPFIVWYIKRTMLGMTPAIMLRLSTIFPKNSGFWLKIKSKWVTRSILKREMLQPSIHIQFTAFQTRVVVSWAR